VITPERMGHGRTEDKPDKRFDVHQMAEDTAAFMQAIGVERADLIGWSDGGNIALTQPGLHSRTAQIHQDADPGHWAATRTLSASSTSSSWRARFPTAALHPSGRHARLDDRERRCIQRLQAFLELQASPRWQGSPCASVVVAS
jgi:hypothetical protein